MTISNTASVKNTATSSRRRQKSAKVKENTAQVIALPVQESPESSAIADTQSNKTNSLPGNVEISDTINVAGMRPIASSDLQVADTVNMAGIRPIASSDLQFTSTVNLVGMRPIGLSNLQFASTVNFSGIRPIASNDIEDIATLIGYLD